MIALILRLAGATQDLLHSDKRVASVNASTFSTLSTPSTFSTTKTPGDQSCVEA